MKKPKRPEIEKWWTTLYYGVRGSGKTLHQAKQVLVIFKYLEWLYWKYPNLPHAIIYSIQKFSKEIEDKYLGNLLYYWIDAKDLRYCPRKNCWRDKKQHRLHGCYLIFDDVATILPADNWARTPMWLRKTFSQGRHFGIRILANLQDPMSVDINFRRYTDMAFKFRKLLGSPDPDETKPAIKRIWGIYMRRKIKAEWLWQLGDMSDSEIAMFKEKQKLQQKISGNVFFKDIWRASLHWISKKICNIYDTTQDVPEYIPTGYEHLELSCTDSKHPDCGFKKVSHSLI